MASTVEPGIIMATPRPAACASPLLLVDFKRDPRAGSQTETVRH